MEIIKADQEQQFPETLRFYIPILNILRTNILNQTKEDNVEGLGSKAEMFFSKGERNLVQNRIYKASSNNENKGLSTVHLSSKNNSHLGFESGGKVFMFTLLTTKHRFQYSLPRNSESKEVSHAWFLINHFWRAGKISGIQLLLSKSWKKPKLFE